MAAGRAKRPAPFFTTRVGSHVVSHAPADPRQARTSAEVRADPRARFKDSYAAAATHFQRWLPSTEPASPSRGAGYGGAKLAQAEDPLAAQAELGLKLELHEARSEIQQLRNALRASASALQHAATLMPPDLGFEIQEDTKLIQDLTSQVQEKDAEIAELRRIASGAERSAMGHKQALLDAMGKWAPSAERLDLLREPFQAWRSIQLEVRQVKKFQEALRKGKESMLPGVMKVVRGLSDTSLAHFARTVMEAWQGLTKGSKWGKKERELKRAKIDQTLLLWGGDFAKTAKPVCFGYWLRLITSRREEKKEEQQRREHMKTVEQMQKEARLKTAMAFASKAGVIDPRMVKIIFQVWHELMTVARLEKDHQAAVDAAEARAAESARAWKEQAQRRAFFMMADTAQARLRSTLQLWKSAIKIIKMKEEEIRLSNLESILRTWCVLAIAGRSAREVENARGHLEKENAELKATREKNYQKRASVLAMAEGQAEAGNRAMILNIVLSAWKEDTHARKLEKEREQERAEYEENFKKRQKEQQDRDRTRAVMIAMGVANKSELVENELLVRSLIQSWVDQVKETKRSKSLDERQLVWEADKKAAEEKAEEEKRRLQHDAETLQAEISKQEMRHKEVHHQRQVLYLMSLGERDREVMLQVCWSAWKECFDDRKNIEIQELRQQLETLRISRQVLSDIDPSAARPDDPHSPHGHPSSPVGAGDVVEEPKPSAAVHRTLCARMIACLCPGQSRRTRPAKVWLLSGDSRYGCSAAILGQPRLLRRSLRHHLQRSRLRCLRRRNLHKPKEHLQPSLQFGSCLLCKKVRLELLLQYTSLPRRACLSGLLR
eukprot:TRINITY_DN29308_c0_g1_i2.p1 TRINITY_DN29308_c0_g1~~TRINITY_DN29308_c0_g1_i2.p1  ORF type:complete len:837 (+),score=173.39 TRINITY_DN29308_c0_g1_i2:146-2656(+)